MLVYFPSFKPLRFNNPELLLFNMPLALQSPFLVAISLFFSTLASLISKRTEADFA
jgi:hypothetical protein